MMTFRAVRFENVLRSRCCLIDSPLKITHSNLLSIIYIYICVYIFFSYSKTSLLSVFHCFKSPTLIRRIHTNGNLRWNEDWFGGSTLWGGEKMPAILQTTYSHEFSWMKVYEFHWTLSPEVLLIILQHWLRKCLGAYQATRHYLNQWWLDHRRVCALLGLNELNSQTDRSKSNMDPLVTMVSQLTASCQCLSAELAAASHRSIALLSGYKDI